MSIFETILHRFGPSGWLVVAAVLATPVVGLLLALVVAYGRRVGRWFVKLAESPRSETHPIWIGIWLLAQLFNLLPSFLRWLVLAFGALVRYAPALAWLLLPLLVAGLGAAGRLRDHATALEGLKTVGLEERNGFLHAGLAVGAEEAAMGLQLAGGMLVVLALFAAVGHYAAAGKEAARSKRALIPLVVGLAASVLTAALALFADADYLGALGVWPLPGAVLLGGVAVSLASVREPGEPLLAREAARGRGFVAVCALLGVAGTWVGMHLDAWAELHKAISWDAELSVMLRVLELQPPTLAGLVAVLGAFALLALALFRRPGPGPAAGVAVSSVLVGLCLGLVIAMHLVAAAGVPAVAEQTEEPTLTDLLEAVPQLPTATDRAKARTVPGFDEAFAWSDSAWRQVVVFERGESATEPRTLLVAAAHDAPASALIDASWLPPTTERTAPLAIDLLVDGPSMPERDDPRVRVAALQTVRLRLDRPARAHGAWDEEDEDDFLSRPWAFVTGPRSNLTMAWFGMEPVPIPEAQVGAAAYLDPRGIGIEARQIVLVPGPDWTTKDLVDFCLAVEAGGAEHDDDVDCGLAAALPDKLLPEPKPEPKRLGRSTGSGSSGPGSRVASGSVDIMGAPEDAAAVSRTMKRYLGRVRQCHERQLRTSPRLAGKVTVFFEITPGSGTVQGAHLVGNTTGNQELADCIVKVVKRIRFNPPPEDYVEVEFPFILSAR